jgi:hypothetical protein
MDSGKGDEAGRQFRSEEVLGFIPREKLETILEEIAAFSVNLVEDPTLPEFGYRYLQSRLAQCREYMNRAQYYLQITRRYEKNLRAMLRNCELNFDLKVMEKLADDVIVRNQSSIEDRKALATTQLRDEFVEMSTIKVDLLNLEETIKIVKARYDDLMRTSNDVRLQRQMVKDDRAFGPDDPAAQGTAQNGMVPGGMKPAVKRDVVNPTDLLDGSKRPEDLPEPSGPGHAKQIARFLNTTPSSVTSRPAPEPAPAAPEEPGTPPVKGLTYDDLLR